LELRLHDEDRVVRREPGDHDARVIRHQKIQSLADCLSETSTLRFSVWPPECVELS
jgi:hypothetical protein